MTREEAKKLIHRHPFWAFASIPDELYEAVECLMEEQEPCEDYISRQAVLDIVDSYSGSQSNVEDVTQDIISNIMALPPVAPKQNDAIGKIRAEIDAQEKWLGQAGYNAYNVDIALGAIKAAMRK